MLVKATIRDRARKLLNESNEGFWLNSDLEAWCDDAAIDISTRTYCYEQSATVTLATNIQTYTAPTDAVKLLDLIYAHKGLIRTTPRMEGIQTAVPTGPPKYYFEVASKIGVFPVPTVTENNTTVIVYYAKTTDMITNIPLKFQVPAVLFVVHMGLAKEKQYTKSGQAFQLYLSALNVERTEIVSEKIMTPPAQDQYILKLTPAQPVQGAR